jgi:catechol 2,3-dioxygenase-like lactoylglutathione lyase family enzyme
MADSIANFILKTKIMEHKAISIRPFIGAKNFEISRSFYRDLGFKESILSDNMSYFRTDGLGFYLQDAYVQDWVDNSMIFLEVDDVDRYWKELLALDLTARYKGVKLSPIRKYDWGRECFMHDPSGILWHIGEFLNK